MFIDASAIVSILTDEPDAAAMAQAIDRTSKPITSPIAIFEAALGIRRKFDLTSERAELNVVRFLAAAGVEVVPILTTDTATALNAFRRYGKGSGHPAGLNLADCFAYAVARNHGRVLLYTGDAFSQTDVGSTSDSETG
jgi:ribonuclease VapC